MNFKKIKFNLFKDHTIKIIAKYLIDYLEKKIEIFI